MTCKRCASPITEDAKFCINCGLRTDHPDSGIALYDAAPEKPAPAPPVITPPPRRKAWPWLVGLGGLVLFLMYAWGNTAYSVDLEAARSAVELIEQEGGITDRSCKPNRAVMPRTYWRSIPNEQTKENLMNALARLCIAEGGGPDMMLMDERGGVIAEFNGTSIVR